jgi:hypothetical protein
MGAHNTFRRTTTNARLCVHSDHHVSNTFLCIKEWCHTFGKSRILEITAEIRYLLMKLLFFKLSLGSSCRCNSLQRWSISLRDATSPGDASSDVNKKFQFFSLGPSWRCISLQRCRISVRDATSLTASLSETRHLPMNKKNFSFWAWD